MYSFSALSRCYLLRLQLVAGVVACVVAGVSLDRHSPSRAVAEAALAISKSPLSPTSSAVSHSSYESYITSPDDSPLPRSLSPSMPGESAWTSSRVQVSAVSSICKDPSFDAATVTDNNSQIWAFKDDNLYRIAVMGDKKPFHLASVYPGCPSRVDAAITLGNTTYIFKDDKVYAYSVTCSVYINVAVPGFPLPSSLVFPGLRGSLRSAFEYRGTAVFQGQDGRYFSGVISDNMASRTVYSVRRTSNPLADVAGDSGLPVVLDAAFTSVTSGFTVLISGRRQYIVDHKKNVFKDLGDMYYWLRC